MLVRYRQPWREMSTLHRQINQVFEELAPFADKQSHPTPAIELEDVGDSLVLRAQLPGIEAKDIDIRVSKEAVSIAGEHRHEQKNQAKGLFKSEFRYGKFQRVITLPAGVLNDQVQAEYKDGVLHLTLPKVPEARNQAVKVNLNELNQVSAAEASEASGV